jgi:hypothetical protein
MEARRKAMFDQVDRERAAFLCYFTHSVLSENQDSPRYATWEHLDPRNDSKVVLVGDLVNKMKCYLTEAQFKAMIRALSKHFDSGEPFNESAFPYDGPKGAAVKEYRWIEAEWSEKERIGYWKLTFDQVGGGEGTILLALDPLPEPFASQDRERYYSEEDLGVLTLRPTQSEEN